MCYIKTLHHQHCTHLSHAVPISECEYGWDVPEQTCRNKMNFIRDTAAIPHLVFCKECLEFRVAILETEFEQKKQHLMDMAQHEGWQRDLVQRSLRDWAETKENAFAKFERNLNRMGAVAQSEADEQVQLDREAQTDWRLQGPDDDLYVRDEPVATETALTDREQLQREQDDAEFYSHVVDTAVDTRELLARIDYFGHHRQDAIDVGRVLEDLQGFLRGL